MSKGSVRASQIQNLLRGLPERYDTLVLRERILIAVAVCVVTFMLWVLGIYDVVSASVIAEGRSIAGINNAIHAEIASQTEMRERQTRAPNEALRQEKLRLKAELAATAEELDRTLSDFVTPDQMPVMLEDILDRHRGLRLVRMVNLAAQPLVLKDSEEETGIYRHGLQMEFEGTYFEVAEFLAAVEQSRWGLRWKHLRYDVSEYPVALVHMEIETLSRSRNLMGV